jgi:hypothetical protein
MTEKMIIDDTTEVAELKIRNFKTKLPNDYIQMISVTTIPKEKIIKTITGTLNDYVIKGYKKTHIYDTFMQIPIETEMQYRSMINQFQNRTYYIKKNEILFIGSYSNFFLFRWVQKFMEYIAPEKVIVKYVNTEQYRSHLY